MPETMENEADETDSTADSDNEHDVPDGEWGWVVAIGCMVINVIYDGCSYSFGILFVNLLDYFGDTKSNTAWIGSLFFSVPLLCGPLASTVAEKFGYRKATMLGGVIAAVGFALGSMATSTWMLCLCYGLVAGFGMSIPYFTASVAVAEYFRRRLALAAGIAECGAGLGTVIFAPITEYLISTYGWRGALLILSGIVGNIVVCGALIRPVKKSRLIITDESKDTYISEPNVPDEEKHMLQNQSVTLLDYTPKTTKNDTDIPLLDNGSCSRHSISHKECSNLCNTQNVRICKSLVNLNNLEPKVLYRSLPGLANCSICDKAINHERQTVHETSERTGVLDPPTSPCSGYRPLLCLPFLSFSACNFVMYFWYDVPYVFTVDRAMSLDVSSRHATFLVSLIGIVHTASNLMYGFLGDRTRLNTPLLYAGSITLCGVALGVVPLCRDYGSMAVTAAGFGVFSAATDALCAIILVQTVGKRQLRRGYGLVMLMEGIANLAGPPVAGLLCDITGQFDATFYVSGACVVLAGTLYSTYRTWAICSDRSRKDRSHQRCDIHVDVDI